LFVITEDETNSLQHYGILRRSGRYPWGSGGNVANRSKSFLDYVSSMQKQGMTEAQVAEGVGLTTKELRALKSIAKAEARAADITFAQRLKAKGAANTVIGERLGINESSVRELLKAGQLDKTQQLRNIADVLKSNVDEKGMIDIGTGVERQLGISKEKLAAAVAMLSEEGYATRSFKIEQVGTGLLTEYKVLVPESVTQKEAWANRANLRQINEFSDDGGRTNLGLLPPLSVDSKRIGINYAEDGGADADGVIFVRPGVADLSLGGGNYAQVRVAVDGTHFLKGMAVYKDDLPAGVDLVFNTNKSSTGNKLDAMKPMKTVGKTGEIDMDNPFGSSINRQIISLGADGKPKVTSAMNLIYEEGTWDTWNRQLSSQFLSKQDVKLARQQLDFLYNKNETALDEIMSLTNPVIKRDLLRKFGDEADAAAVHLAAAAMPRQSTKVLIPSNSMKPTEVYAPTYRNGERVVLVRHPHGGTFEIPELVVNNRDPATKKLLGNAPDAIGINAEVAKRLSGADFDGDTVIVIPNDRGQVKTSPPLKALQNFDPIREYPAYEGMPTMRSDRKQMEMGSISNLITDMTIMGATQTEIARAVKHSMVVIDAEKHNLNYKQSYLDNGIPALKEKYLGRSDKGASTLISLAGSRVDVPERQPRRMSKGGPIDPATGRKVYEYTGRTYVDKTGKVVSKTQRSEKLAETDDAFTLSAGTRIETEYATYSNRMKALANRARKESLAVKNIPYSPSAKKVYEKEVKSLDAKLNLAEKNAPRERQAQIVANAIRAAKRRDNPDMTREEKKKIDGMALVEARARTGAGKARIDISPKEWEAIQAGAITTSKLESILRNSDAKKVKELATPRTSLLMTSTKTSQAKALLKQGYTQAEVADAIGVSLTTLKTSLA
jgi:hypothetical protein